MMSKKILITGGAGFIGSALSLELLNRGHEVRVLDCLSKQVHGPNPMSSELFKKIENRVDFLHGDVTCKEDLITALTGMDTVVHLAAETGTGQSMYQIEKYVNVNIGGTGLLLDLIVNHSFPIAKLVVASSRAVCGEGKYECKTHGVQYPKSRLEENLANGRFEHYCPICSDQLELSKTDEDSSLEPASIYGVTKLSQEQLMLTAAKATGISAIAYRYQNVYGPGQSLTNPYTGILSIFSTQFRQNKPVNIFEDGLESRDFVYIDDVVNATILGIEYPHLISEILNVGSGISTSVLDLAFSLRKILNSSSTINVSGQYRAGDIRHNIADLRKIESLLGFKPETSIEEGLEKFCQWVRLCPVNKENQYEKSLDELRSKGLFK
jgi:dTDP-L-rhamnose 4-epimerase